MRGSAELEGPHFSGNGVVLLDGRTIWVELQELLFSSNVRGSGALLFVLADQVGPAKSGSSRRERVHVQTWKTCHRDIR